MPVGHPPKFKQEITDKVLYAVGLGAPLNMACNYAGVDYSTFRKWVIAGESGEEQYIEFLQALKRAQGGAGVHWLEKINEAMENGTWQAAAWKLERKFYKDFSQHAPIMEMAKEIAEVKDKQEQLKNGKKMDPESDT